VAPKGKGWTSTPARFESSQPYYTPGNSQFRSCDLSDGDCLIAATAAAPAVAFATRARAPSLKRWHPLAWQAHRRKAWRAHPEFQRRPFQAPASSGGKHARDTSAVPTLAASLARGGRSRASGWVSGIYHSGVGFVKRPEPICVVLKRNTERLRRRLDRHMCKRVRGDQLKLRQCWMKTHYSSPDSLVLKSTAWARRGGAWQGMAGYGAVPSRGRLPYESRIVPV
jgi:hypothetical protein